MRFPELRSLRALFILLCVFVLSACGGEGQGEPVHVTVPAGSSFSQIADSLAARDIIGNRTLFQVYGRVRGAAGSLKPGTYAFRKDLKWDRILADLKAGRVVTAKLTIPEAYDIFTLAPRFAQITGLTPDSIIAVMMDPATAEKYGVPGPSLEGYLYPATYTFPLVVSLDSVLKTVVSTYRREWTPARKARADSMGLSEREVVTLASILEREAKKLDEMPVMSAVYHNRLRIGMPLQADPTVQYALGKHRARLTYAAIDSAAGNPYNTYKVRGLPPGPIASPSARGIDAALNPDSSDYLYFVARADGSHAFTRSLQEHNREKLAIQRARAAGAAQKP